MSDTTRARGDDNRLPRLSTETLGLAVMILVQTAGIVWWASGISNRVSALEETVKPLSDGSMSSTLARIDERTNSMKERLTHMSDRLYQLPAPSAPSISVVRQEHDQ